MAEKRVENMITHTMTSGLILGGLLVACDLLSSTLFSTNAFMLLLLSLAAFIIPIYCIFHFTKKFDKEILNGGISYGKALSYGFYMFFFASMIIAFFSFIYLQYINPANLDQRINMAMNAIGMLNMPEETVKKYEALLIESGPLTATSVAIGSLWEFTFRGVIISLFTSIFFRQKKREENINY